MIDVVSYLNNGLATSAEREVNSDLDKDAFMQLLVAQMSYQDPLEPMDNSQFISQLAEFSALEQQQNIAENIELLALTQNAATNAQMVNLIGKRVVIEGDQVSLDGEKGAELRFELSEEAQPAEIIITNSSGEEVRTIQTDELVTGMNSIQFDGKDNDGNLLEAGTYTYTIKTADGETMEGVTQYANYLVDSVNYDDSDIVLKSNNVVIDLGDVSEVIDN